MSRRQTQNRAIKTFVFGGIIAGPFFLITIVCQIFTRTEYDFAQQPISFLRLGDGGWIQILNFVVGGILSLGVAVAAHRTLYTNQRFACVPVPIGGFGIGLIIAGLFPPDPAFGFPPGTLDGMPATVTYLSVLNGVSFMLSFGSLTVACMEPVCSMK